MAIGPVGEIILPVRKVSEKEKWTRRRYRTVIRTIMDLESGAKREVILTGADNPIMQDLRDAGYRVIQQGPVTMRYRAYRWRILTETPTTQ